MLTATLEKVDQGFVLLVYKSVRVTFTGALFKPVRDVIENFCTLEIDTETVRDAGMMFGKAVRSIVRVWEHCPAITHDCVHLPIPAAREGEECLDTDQSVSSRSTKTVRIATISTG